MLSLATGHAGISEPGQAGGRWYFASRQPRLSRQPGCHCSRHDAVYEEVGIDTEERQAFRCCASACEPPAVSLRRFIRQSCMLRLLRQAMPAAISRLLKACPRRR